MAGNRDERQRCWDYLNWLLKQRRGPLSVSPKGRDDVTELKIPRGSAGRLQGKRAENLRSIERETKTFCFITEAKSAGSSTVQDFTPNALATAAWSVRLKSTL